MKTITITIRDVDGEPFIDDAAMALLIGVDSAAIHAVRGEPFPKEWTQAGRRRAREAMAANGSDFILDSLRYWARKDHNAELLVVTQ